jgi:hypothetical protein
MLKRLFIGLLLLVLLLVALSYLLPRDVHVSRKITIDAPASEIFPLVNSLQETSKWSPWLETDADVRLVFSGPDSGVGNRMAWRSENPEIGSGTQVITASEPSSRVATDLEFGEMGAAHAEFLLTNAGTGTLVTWRLNADMGLNPVHRWMGLLMDRWVGADYETGLRNLKARVESQ